LSRGVSTAQARARADVEYLVVFSDSRTLVNQVNNLWNKNENLAELCDQAQNALRRFKGTQISWVPREWNKSADELVNRAFDSPRKHRSFGGPTASALSVELMANFPLWLSVAHRGGQRMRTRHVICSTFSNDG
jgi:hypothetical protein